MIVTAHRLRSIGWIVLLAICAALTMVLAFRVNALRSQVHHAEMKIVALQQEKMYLETEFETRANQQQLKAWNDVEFGYVAPMAGQYLENERELAALSKPVEPDAPAPIRVASADDAVVAQAAFPAMVSPLSGKPLSDAKAEADERPAKVDHAAAAASLGERLAKVDRGNDAPVKPRVRQLVARDGDKAEKPAKTARADKITKPEKVAKADKPTKPVKVAVKSDKPVDKPKAKASASAAAPVKATKVAAKAKEAKPAAAPARKKEVKAAK
ncbi:hypothetical protein [Novosphingobium percolationis]|uniref:hypothetical protein n=1 Tax=Novosphingobium percolationis TaxID=2871811 RepID=UPI001CD6D282|nr:hypothetical protein [Novosphingobium percolationis]